MLTWNASAMGLDVPSTLDAKVAIALTIATTGSPRRHLSSTSP